MTFETITCPYCFHKFEHYDVHFRSDTVNKTECPAIPDEYDDVEDFISRYKRDDKEMILQQVKAWDFFKEKPDKVYDDFWKKYGGSTTEKDPTDDRKGIVPYHRPVIDPDNSEHQSYLKRQQNDTYLITDDDGFVVAVQDITGNNTDRRVCPHCHNPLPNEYGKYPIKFVTVIGITHSGKTVYLSQLLRNLKDYAVKVGQAVTIISKSTRRFVKENPVKEGKPLPGSTPPETFLQPLFYEFHQSNNFNQLINNTFVLYDIAGENCTEPEYITEYGEFIPHADGIILLIDPMQFRSIQDISDNFDFDDDEEEESEPERVLDAIHQVIRSGRAGEKCPIPIAVCIPKSDMPAVQKLFDDDLVRKLMRTIDGNKDPLTNRNMQLFNSDAYNPIGMKLKEFVEMHEPSLEMKLYNLYSCYNYFAFSSLGCDVDDDNRPVGLIAPKRIEEPLLWLWHEFGYIGANPPVIRCGAEPLPVCEVCGCEARRLPENERAREEKGLFGRKRIVQDTYECLNPACRHRW